ncbi:NUDIX hydrolase [Thiohalobacter sp. IOR34]|nr:NUDIX hydrolase [Thiohalobacter sp. IOR34]WJW74398.1 NUDIX hydrolase [Thiohalobacter sp. IOR34]
MVWKPHVTVAAVIERQGCFLLVEERIEGRLRLNQPAGHLEAGEDLCQAVQREVLEETAHRFTPETLVGIYLWRHGSHGETFLRATFAGHAEGPLEGHVLDTDIQRTLWLDADQLRRRQNQWRSPLVMRAVEDYLAGHRYPLSLLVGMLEG